MAQVTGLIGATRLNAFEPRLYYQTIRVVDAAVRRLCFRFTIVHYGFLQEYVHALGIESFLVRHLE